MVKRNPTGGEVFFGCLLLIVLLVFFTVLWAGVFMLAWNTFMVAVFALPAINFWQALAATVLLSFVGSAFRAIFR